MNDYCISIFGDDNYVNARLVDINELKDVCDKDEYEQIINNLADLEDHVEAFHQIFE